MRLAPIRKQSLSDHVFEQLVQRIVSGALEPGASLPSERSLCDALGVNRGAIREAVKRLSQAGLVASQHGSGHKVLDYRRHADLSLLPRLLGHDADRDVLRAVVEMRAAIAPDAARLCAERSPETATALADIVRQLRQARTNARKLELSTAFWDTVVDACGNVAYRLASNALISTVQHASATIGELLAGELADADAHQAIVDAIGHGSGFSASCEAAAVVEHGLNALEGGSQP